MRIITRKRLNDFAEKHPDAKSALQHWYKLAKRKDFKSFDINRGSHNFSPLQSCSS